MLIVFSILTGTAVAQPANNNFASATVLTHGPIASGCSANAAYTTVAATNDMSPGSCWNTTGGSNVWFKFTATSTQMHFEVIAGGSVATGGTLQYAYAALWDNAGTTQLNCNTYVSQYSGIILNYTSLSIGQDYYISVDNHNGSSAYRGTFKICLGDVSDYDFYESAQALAMPSTSADAAYTTAQATNDKNPGSCWNTTGGSNRWFSFVATSTTATANLYTGGAEGTLQYPYMAIWQANGTTQVSCVTYISQYSDLEISAVGLVPGNTYYISVDNHNGSSGYRGSFKIGINSNVTYDFYEGAQALAMPSTSADAAYTTAQATNDKNPGSCWNTAGGSNRWFSFVATSTTVTANLYTGGAEGTLQYPYMAIWQANGTTQVSCVTYISQYSDLEISAVGLVPGNTYYISVDNHNGSSGYRGSFKIGINSNVTYDFYEGAQALAMPSTSADAAYTTAQATNDKNSGSCWNTTGGSNRWFSFVATTATVTANLYTGGAEGTLQYPYMAIWQANGTTQVSCVTYISQYSDLEISAVGLVPGNTYYISVDNHNGSSGYRGSFKIGINSNVTYDFYEGAQALAMPSTSADAAYTTAQATNDKNPGSCWNTTGGSNRWFSFVATTATVTANLYTGGAEGTLQYPYMAIWQANGTTQVSCVTYISQYSDLEISAVGLVPGNTYYISVDNHNGSSGYRGSFKLGINSNITYDFYEGAQDVTPVINTCSGNAVYTTQQATNDRSPGSCWNTTGGSNRWFKFTATAKAQMQIQVRTGSTEGTLQYAYMAVWDATLSTQLACQQYVSQYSDIEANVVGLTPGATYYVSVDNHNGSSGYRGSFTMCLSDVADYDYYDGAKTIGDLDSWCSLDAEFSTIGATVLGTAGVDDKTGTCKNTSATYNRWFKFTAIYTTATIEVRTGGAEGTLQYGNVVLWDSSPVPVQLACANYTSQYSDLSVTYASLTVGQVYYISVDNHNGSAGYRGSFKLCVNNVDPIGFYSIQSGSWSDVNTWSRASHSGPTATATPGSGQKVYIQGHTVSINSGSETCATLNITANDNPTAFNIDGIGSNLTVTGNMNTANTGNNFDCNINITNGGNLNVQNDALFTRSGGANQFALSLDNSTMAITRDLKWISSGGSVVTNEMVLNNGSTLTVTRDLYLSHTAGMKINNTINGTSVLSVAGDINFTGTTSAASTEIILNNSATLNIAGDFLRGAGAAAFGNITSNNASTVTFNATSLVQTFPTTSGAGGDDFYFNNVTINNTNPNPGGDQLIAAGPATINGTLTLTSGIVQTTSTNVLTLASTATTSIGNAASFIDGPMKFAVATSGSSTVNFPIGKITAANVHWRPVILSVNHLDNISITYTSEMFNSSAATLGYTLAPTTDRVSGARYWTISRTTNAPDNFSNATATLYYGTTPFDDEVTDFVNLTVVKNVGAGTTWVDIGGSATGNGDGNITSGSFNTFSNFTIANLIGGSNPLPVELVFFTGEFDGQSVVLKWKTASELNNDYFSVQRTIDGKKYDEIERVFGAGTTSMSSNYSYIDHNPHSGKNYYMLEQVDFDGMSSKSNLIMVDLGNTDIKFVSTYPNPGKVEDITIKLSGFPPDTELSTNIFSINGQPIISVKGYTNHSGLLLLKLEKPMTPGIYLLKVAGTSMYQKIIIHQ